MYRAIPVMKRMIAWLLGGAILCLFDSFLISSGIAAFWEAALLETIYFIGGVFLLINL